MTDYSDQYTKEEWQQDKYCGQTAAQAGQESYNEQAAAGRNRKEGGDGKKSSHRQKGLGMAKRMCAVAVASVVFGCGAGASFYAVNQLLEANANEAGAEEETLEAATEAEEADATLTASNVSYTETTSSTESMTVAEVAETALPSIVSITNVSVQEVQSYFNAFGNNRGSMELEETTSCGSGIIIEMTDTTVYIVTNCHVVEDATTLSVTFADDSTYEATLCGSDEDNDIAVISIELDDLSEDTLEAITVAVLGDSDFLVVGEQVVAIGNALGYGQSVTVGYVSALNRSLSDDSDLTYIQTDAAINPGNSGGALLNMYGQVIGINTAKMSSTEIEGMGYAIPISQVLDLIEELKGDTSSDTTSSDQDNNTNDAMPSENGEFPGTLPDSLPDRNEDEETEDGNTEDGNTADGEGASSGSPFAGGNSLPGGGQSQGGMFGGSGSQSQGGSNSDSGVFGGAQGNNPSI